MTTFTSSILMLPMACDQLLPNRQIECADAYFRVSGAPVDEGDRKRRDRHQ